MSLTLTPNQRIELAEKLDLDPWTLTPQRIASRMSAMQDPNGDFSCLA